MKPALLFYFLNFSSQNWFHACFFRQSLLPLLSLLFTHMCPATGFCRCCAFQIGKICCQNCIVRNFQFRKFLPVNSYPLSFIPSARQNVNEIFLIKITPFLHSKKRRHCKQVRRFLPDIGCWLSTDTEKIPAENLGQFVTECNASRNFE